MVRFSENYLIKEYLVTIQIDGLSSNTVNNRRIIINYWEDYVNNVLEKPLEVVTTIDVRQWIADQQGQVKATTINTRIKGIRYFYNWLVSEEIIEKNPFDRIKFQKEILEIAKPYSKTQLRQLASFYDGNSFLQQRNKLLIIMYIETGIRNSELRNIKLEDLFDNSIRIFGKGA